MIWRRTLLIVLITSQVIEGATNLTSEITRIEAQCSTNSIEFGASSLLPDAVATFTPQPIEVNDEAACQMMCCTLDTCNAYIYEEESKMCSVLICPTFDSCFKSILPNQLQKKVVMFGDRYNEELPSVDELKEQFTHNFFNVDATSSALDETTTVEALTSTLTVEESTSSIIEAEYSTTEVNLTTNTTEMNTSTTVEGQTTGSLDSVTETTEALTSTTLFEGVTTFSPTTFVDSYDYYPETTMTEDTTVFASSLAETSEETTTSDAEDDYASNPYDSLMNIQWTPQKEYTFHGILFFFTVVVMFGCCLVLFLFTRILRRDGPKQAEYMPLEGLPQNASRRLY